MARINIEDSIYKDTRFFKLAAQHGKAKAIGLCVLAWDLAHRHYLKHPEGLVPISEWDREEELMFIELVGLAERKENGIYVKGSNEHCEYLTKRSASGKRGGLKSQENFRSKLKQIEQNQPSYSYSYSNSKEEEEYTTNQASPSDTNFFLNLWNENRGGMPEVKALSTKRKKSCIARLKDNPSQAYWHEVITRMANSKFCCGENNQGWKADFDFLLKPDTHLKVLEGKYDNKSNNAGKKIIGKEKLNFGDDDAS